MADGLRQQALSMNPKTAAGNIPLTRTRDRAIQLAAAEIGLKHFDVAHAKTTEVSISDAGVPFVFNAISGRKTWCVDFDNVDLVLASGGNGALSNGYVKHLVVRLAPDTGHVLRVVSTWPEGVPPIAPFPTRAEEETQLQSIAVKFTGLPADPPTVSLFDALANPEIMYWSKDVKQLVAYYVNSSERNGPDRAVWVVQVRGIPPITTFARRFANEIPIDARNHFRNVIDAKSGQWIGSDTIPQPITSDLEKRF